MVQDEFLPNSFVICTKTVKIARRSVTRCLYGQHNSNGFSTNERGIVNFDNQHNCFRLIDEKLYGLKYDNRLLKVFYWAREISGEINTIFMFESDDEFDVKKANVS